MQFTSLCKSVLLPVAKSGPHAEIMCKNVLLWWNRLVQTEKCVMLHTGFPQILTGSVVYHVKAQ